MRIFTQLLLRLIVLLIPVLIIYYSIFFSKTYPIENQIEVESNYSELKQKYILPAAEIFGNDTDITALEELDQKHQEKVSVLQKNFDKSFTEDNTSVYYIPPDPYMPVNVTNYSAYADYLYQNIERLQMNPVYYLNTVLFKHCKKDEEKISDILVSPDVSMPEENSDLMTFICNFIRVVFSIDEQIDLTEYIHYTDHDPNYSDRLYYFYCVDFRDCNLNLYAIYFSFSETGSPAFISYDNAIVYGNDLLKDYASSNKDLYAAFSDVPEPRDRFYEPALTINTIFSCLCSEQKGSMSASDKTYSDGAYNAGILHHCELKLYDTDDEIMT